LIRLTRREWALALLSTLASPTNAIAQSPRDQGIGGTGAAPKPPTIGDRGIGGTGVIGTIRRFGSIYVNDLRIAYQPGAAVFIDDAPARVADMKIGHVAQAIASGPNNALVTSRIDIASEVIGPVDRIVPNGMIVLGQVVDLRGVKQRPAGVGKFVAVFGQRRANGVIVASLVEPRGAGPTKVAGPIIADASGRMSIGGLPVRGVASGLAGSRVSLEGSRQGGVYNVTRFRSLARPFGPEVSRVSIEGYAGASGRSLGSGLAVSGLNSRSGLVVVTGRVSESGALIAETVRQDTRVQVPDLGGPAPLQPTTGLIPLDGLGGGANPLGGTGNLLPGAPGALPSAPSLPSIGVPPAPNIGIPGGIGVPALRR
jgi:hypothetical protein